MLYPCICNVVISCWKSGAYGFVICRSGTDMCFVLGFGRKRPNLKQYRISGLTSLSTCLRSIARTPFFSILSSPPPKLVDLLGFERARPDLQFHQIDLCSLQDFFTVDFVTLGDLAPRWLGVRLGSFLACGVLHEVCKGVVVSFKTNP